MPTCQQPPLSTCPPSITPTQSRIPPDHQLAKPPGAGRSPGVSGSGCWAKDRWRLNRRMSIRKALAFRYSSYSLWAIGGATIMACCSLDSRPLCFSGSHLSCLKSCIVPGPARMRKSRVASMPGAPGFGGTLAILMTS